MTRDQYNQIMQVYTDRRREAETAAQRRRDEVELKIPGYVTMELELDQLRLEALKARMSGDAAKAAECQQKISDATEKRNELLQQFGYNEDYFKVQYHCPLCQDTGYTGSEKCGCMRQLESELIDSEASLPLSKSSGDFLSFDFKAFDDSRILEELKGLQLTQRQYMRRKVLPAVKRYLDQFSEPGSHNLFITGPAGTGKTFLCSCIARKLIDRQFTVFYVASGKLFELFERESYPQERTEELLDTRRRLGECQVLLIDDLGTDYPTERTKSRFFSLINGRQLSGLSTIISSNLSLNDISIVYGERIVSRLSGDYMLLPFYGSDIRLRKMGGLAE